MALTRVTAPAVQPLSLSEVKSHLRVEHTNDDGLIDIYLRGATDYLDGFNGFLGRCLVPQTWLLTIDEFPTAEIEIPLPPLISVDHVKYDDPDGNEQTVSTANYFVDKKSEPGWVVPLSGVSWPTPLDGVNAVRVQFQAGYSPSADSPEDSASGVPGNIKSAILLMVGNSYENREDTVVGTVAYKLPNGAEPLLRRHKFDTSFA